MYKISSNHAGQHNQELVRLDSLAVESSHLEMCYFEKGWRQPIIIVFVAE